MVNKKEEDIILKQLYPLVKKNATPAAMKDFKKMMNTFISDRYAQLYDIAPCDRIVFSETDANKLFEILNIDRDTVKEIIRQTYYGEITNFSPLAAKDPFTILMMTFMRFLVIDNKDKTNIELGLIFLSFSGKFYPSIHYRSYPKFTPSEYRHVMEYVVNNELSQKYDIKKYGSIMKAILSLSNTWLDTYMDRFKSFDDEDIVYLINQLYSRIGSFTINIAEVYYKVYEAKENYITYDSDNMEEDNYRLADNDSLLLERYVENAMIKLTSSSVDYSRCKTAASGKIKTDELKGIIETILSDNKNVPLIRELVTILISEYFVNSKDKDVSSINFISSSITAKPNTKNPNIIRQQEILEYFLSENSPAYRKRSSPLATKLAYHKALLYYIVLTIHSVGGSYR